MLVVATAPCKQQAKEQEAFNPCAKPREAGCARSEAEVCTSPAALGFVFTATSILHCAWVRFGKELLARLGRLGRARPNALSDLVKSSTTYKAGGLQLYVEFGPCNLCDQIDSLTNFSPVKSGHFQGILHAVKGPEVHVHGLCCSNAVSPLMAFSSRNLVK